MEQKRLKKLRDSIIVLCGRCSHPCSCRIDEETGIHCCCDKCSKKVAIIELTREEDERH